MLSKTERLEKYIYKVLMQNNINTFKPEDVMCYTAIATNVGPLYIVDLVSNKDETIVRFRFKHIKEASRYFHFNLENGEFYIKKRTLREAEKDFKLLAENIVNLRCGIGMMV